jgi:putative tricarboxylic transport membrane protein
MYRTKRLISSLMTLALMLTVTACSSKPAATPEPAKQPAAESPKPAEPAKPAWPTKPVTIVSHTAAGGGMDVFLRELAPLLQKQLGQPVVIENRAGGSGATAIQYVAGQPTDGYTLLGLTDTLVITPIKSATPKGMADVTPVAMTVTDPSMFFVRADSKYKTAKELFDAAKAGTRIPVAVSNVGSPEAMALEALIKDHGMKGFVMVPNDAGAEGLTQLLGGQVEVAMGEPAESMAQIKANQIRAIVTFNTKRLPSMPNVPTTGDEGYPVVIDKFRGFGAPKGVPDDVIKAMEAAVKRMFDSPEYKAMAEKNNQIPTFLGSADFAKFLAEKDQKYRAYFKK